jgi:hypothetical protein
MIFSTFFTAKREKERQHHEEPEGRVFKELSSRVIGCATGVHRLLGPGMLESSYQRFPSNTKELPLNAVTASICWSKTR